MSLTFDWRGFAKFLMNKMDCVPVPLKRDGTQAWDGWEKLLDKKITDADLDRWISSKDFGGFAGFFKSQLLKIPVILSPTVNELKDADPFICAFASVDPQDLSIDWSHFTKSAITKYVPMTHE